MMEKVSVCGAPGRGFVSLGDIFAISLLSVSKEDFIAIMTGDM